MTLLYLGTRIQPQVQHIVEQAGVKNLLFRRTLEEALELTQGDIRSGVNKNKHLFQEMYWCGCHASLHGNDSILCSLPGHLHCIGRELSSTLGSTSVTGSNEYSVTNKTTVTD